MFFLETKAYMYTYTHEWICIYFLPSAPPRPGRGGLMDELVIDEKLQSILLYIPYLMCICDKNICAEYILP